MNPSSKLLIATFGWIFAMSRVTWAQFDTPQSTEAPNWMGVHTWFILLAFGALLGWAISYSLQLQKEILQRKRGRDTLIQHKEAILDEIAELETRKENGELTETRYQKELKDLKLRLSRVIEQLGAR